MNIRDRCVHSATQLNVSLHTENAHAQRAVTNNVQASRYSIILHVVSRTPENAAPKRSFVLRCANQSVDALES